MTTHPEVLFLPVLMLVDYFLTVVGARLAEGGYRRHFRFPDYELNPAFQKNIAEKKWFSARHVGAVAVVSAVCIGWYVMWQEEDALLDGLRGGMFAVFATIIGGHVANILTFYYLRKHPEQVTGEVVMEQKYVRHLTRGRLLMTLVPLAVAAGFEQTPFLAGAALGVVALMGAQTVWMWREERRRRGEGGGGRVKAEGKG